MKLLAQKSAKGSRAKGSGALLGAGLGSPKWGQLTDGQREQRMSELAKASMKQGGVLGPDMEAVAMDGGGLLARMTSGERRELRARQFGGTRRQLKFMATQKRVHQHFWQRAFGCAF